MARMMTSVALYSTTSVVFPSCLPVNLTLIWTARVRTRRSLVSLIL